MQFLQEVQLILCAFLSPFLCFIGFYGSVYLILCQGDYKFTFDNFKMLINVNKLYD